MEDKRQNLILPEATAKKLLQMASTLNGIKAQIDLVVTTYLEATGNVGPSWVLTPDGSKLIEVFPKEDPESIAKNGGK